MLTDAQLEKILFLDIETVPQERKFTDLAEDWQELYAEKTKYLRKDDYSAEEYYERAGIWAEFGKIVCISIGYFSSIDPMIKFRVRSFVGDEMELLRQFTEMLTEHFNKRNHLLCAHNGKEFDFPYIARRLVINGLNLPAQLNNMGKKPWEIPHLDTLEMWKFGDYKHYTSLKLLTKILNIPSPKNDIDGSQVRTVYYEDNDINRIKDYCEQDVVAVAQLLLKFINKPLILPENIHHV